MKMKYNMVNVADLLLFFQYITYFLSSLALIPFIVKSGLHILPDNTYSKSDDTKLGYFALRNISSIYPSLSNIDNIIW